jgi:quercetin dioxygenase-like cupin family protein
VIDARRIREGALLRYVAKGGDMRSIPFVMAAMSLMVSTAMAQDPVKVDAKHYKVELENEHVRVLKIHYGPHEKSVMHEHPDSVAVFLTDGEVRFGLPDGKTEDTHAKAGTAQFTPAGKHLPENLGDKPFDVMLVELKGKPAASHHAAAKTDEKKPAK